MYYYGARYYAAWIARFVSVDPLQHKYPHYTPYQYAGNKPVTFIDLDGLEEAKKDGKVNWPVPDKYKGESPRVDSWWGPRNVKGGSKFHRGLDINFGSGRFDYGAPVLSTHDGIVFDTKNTTSGSGRSVTIQSPDGSFQTFYCHLKSISVKKDSEIKEGQQIGTIGGSGKGGEVDESFKKGYPSHLHYAIKKPNPTTGEMEYIDPTEGKGKSVKNIVNPQEWITPKEEITAKDIFIKKFDEVDNVAVKKFDLILIYIGEFENKETTTHLTVTADKLNMRTNPSIKGDIITQLSKDDEIKETGKLEGDWIEVINSAKQKGWVHSNYVK